MADNYLTLPAPRHTGTVSLEEALQSRRSVRDFAATPLHLIEVSQLAWAAQGVTDPAGGGRTAPSAGALYPLELYLVAGRVEGLSPGVYRYDPFQHRLEQRSGHDVRVALAAAAFDQSWVAHGAAVVVIAGVEARLARKYGRRAARYMTLEAGHAAQNLLLQATALGLAAAPVGAFDDRAVARELQLQESETPLYLIPIGKR